MRTIRFLVVHCTATSQNATVEAIKRYWRETLGWKNPGYHYLIDRFGELHQLAELTEVTNGVKGHNHHSIHVSYIGGIAPDGSPLDTRNGHQKRRLAHVLNALKKQFPTATIQGHRDFAGVNKACPSYDAKTEYKDII